MSRRKQAKPKALSVRQDDDEGVESEGSSLSSRDEHSHLDLTGKPPRISDADLATNHVDTTDVDSQDSTDNTEVVMETNPPLVTSAYKCEACACAFSNLQQFMDHRNYDCQAMGEYFGTHATSPNLSESQGSNTSSQTRTAMDSARCSPEILGNALDTSSPWPPGSSSSTHMLALSSEEVPWQDGVDSKHPYGCEFCNKAFQRQRHLRDHEQVHTEHLPFSCDQCQRVFRTKKSRDRHAKNHSAQRFSCQQCQAVFSRVDKLTAHMNKAHPASKNMYPCVMCEVSYERASDLVTHLKTHEESASHAKEIEVGTPSSTGETEQVETSRTKQETPCQHCEKIFMSSEALEFHVQQMHPEVCPTRCPLCLSELMDARELLEHMQWHARQSSTATNSSETSTDAEHKGKSIVKGECTTCGKAGFSSEGALRDHMREHGDSGRINSSCFMCGKALHTHDEMASHLQMEHPSQYYNMLSKIQGTLSASLGISSYPCEFCPMNFADSESLCMHRESVHKQMGISSQSKNESTVLCAQCNAAFPNIYSLAQHVQTSHGYARSSTPSGFSGYPNGDVSQQHLLSPRSANKTSPTRKYGLHIVSPNGLRVRTPTNGNLDGLNLTTPEKDASSLRCTVCQAECPDVVSLRLHERCHMLSNGSYRDNDSLPWKCDLCSLSFADMSSYTNHCSTVHLGEGVANGFASESEMPSEEGHMTSEGRYRCKECSAGFDTEERLEIHMSRHYLRVDKDYGCTSCKKMFDKPDDLQKHLIDIHAHHLYRCSLCKELFESKVDIQVHFAVKHSNECPVYKCTKCAATFRSEMEWQVHVKIEHLNTACTLRCFICQAAFTSESELQSHVTTHKKLFECHLCREAFHVEFLLDKHLQEKHADSAMFIESNGDRSVSTRMRTSDKANRDKGVSPTSCSPALKSSALRTALQADPGYDFSPRYPSPKKTMINPSFKCEICGVTTNSEEALLNHKANSHKIGKISMSTSPRESGSKSPRYSDVNSGRRERATSEMHISEDEPTDLSMASKTLDQLSPGGLSFNGQDNEWPGFSLKEQHAFLKCRRVSRILGMDEFSQTCIYCHQGFKTKTELEKHIKSHVTSSNQKCNICDQVFPSASVLAEHKLTHCKVVRGDVCVVCKLVMSGEEHFYVHSQEHGLQGNTMTCIVCRQTLCSIYELQLHGRAHFQAKTSPYSCTVCSREYDSPDQVIAKSDSTGKKYYICNTCYTCKSPSLKCSVCNVKCYSQAELEAHKTVHKKTFQCIKCQESFETEYEIQLHVASHMLTEGNQHWCKICNQCFESPAKLQCHLIEHSYEGKPLKCYVCETVSPDVKEMQRHMLEHGLSARRYSCSQCKQAFFFKSEMLNHLYVMHGAKPSATSYTCPECHQTFGNVMNLNQHRKLHETLRDTTLKCTRCPLTFSSFNQVQQHFMSMHAGSDKENKVTSFVCSALHCDVTCSSAEDLQKHAKAVHGKVSQSPEKAPSPEYACTHCDMQYSSFQAYEAHVKNHTDIFSCPTCHKTFSRRESMRSHMKCHTGIKPYRCTVCEQTFSSKTQLKIHMETHMNEQYCDKCDQNFKSSKDLWRHQVIMHNMKSGHTCHVCNSTYSDAEDLECHMRRVHGLEKLSWSVKDKNGHRCVVCNSPYKHLKDLEFHVQQIHGFDTSTMMNSLSSVDGNDNDTTRLDNSGDGVREGAGEENMETGDQAGSENVILLRNDNDGTEQPSDLDTSFSEPRSLEVAS